MVPASPGEPRYPSHECACCGGRYPVRNRRMRLFHYGTLDGDICPDCVLAGPAGAAAKTRTRLTALREESGHGDGGRKRVSLVRRMERRARMLDGTPSFSLAARQAAVRETRERR
jgi:hypothetical protein